MSETSHTSVYYFVYPVLLLTLSAFPPVLGNFGMNRWSILRPFTGAITPQEEEEEEKEEEGVARS